MTEKTDPLRERIKKHIPEDVRKHTKAARSEMKNSVESLFPPEFLKSRRAARKEMLLAAQKMIDHAIERLENKES